MLHFDNQWRFDSPGRIEQDAVTSFLNLINRISGQGNRKAILEHFKSFFSAAAGKPHFPSSNENWARQDLEDVMNNAADNAPLFIEAFYDACDFLRQSNPDMALPDIIRINHVLSDVNAGYQINPPNLIATHARTPIVVPNQPPSLDTQANILISRALNDSERALAEGNGRQAVHELLWFLETISTAFRSPTVLDGSIQGRYFNKIIGELRQRGSGHQKHILEWMMTLHGYLSSPTGGGIRHGFDLQDGRELQISEARLYCDLIRSYLKYLIAEHEQLSQRGA